MKKTTRNTLIMIIILLLIFAIIFVWYQHIKIDPIETNTTSGNVLNDANIGLENILDNILEDANVENEENVENSEEKENTSNSEKQNENEDINKNDETEIDNQMTPKEEKAINLAKEQWKSDWGNLNDVSFNVSVRSDGKYIVTVYDITTTELIQGYIVDVETETVKEK